MRKAFVPLAAMALITSAAGCGVQTPDDGLPAVATTDLQSDITARLSEAGATPESVSCRDPLPGEVGQTARCEVVLGPTNRFEPIVTVTAVDGDRIEYELTPALSPEQLERAVTRLVDEAGGPPTSHVECRTGLLGVLGETAQCEVTADGVTLRRTAEVTSLDGLLMNFDLVPILTKTEVEQSLLAELARHVAQPPDAATCSGDLEGRPGNTVDCAVVAGPETATFVLTVTAVDGTNIDYSYAPRD